MVTIFLRSNSPIRFFDHYGIRTCGSKYRKIGSIIGKSFKYNISIVVIDAAQRIEHSPADLVLLKVPSLKVC